MLLRDRANWDKLGDIESLGRVASASAGSDSVERDKLSVCGVLVRDVERSRGLSFSTFSMYVLKSVCLRN